MASNLYELPKGSHYCDDCIRGEMDGTLDGYCDKCQPIAQFEDHMQSLDHDCGPLCPDHGDPRDTSIR